MIKSDRLVNDFIELVHIDSLSLRERQIADVLKGKIEKLGYNVIEDETAQKIKGNCGNLIFKVKGSKKTDTILIMAHMDTVVPGIGKNPIIDGDCIRTDGTTVLGGDDLAGIVTILETLRVLKEDDIQHGDIEVVFTVAEEIGLLGSRNLDYTKFNAKYGFVLDSDGEIGSVAVKAPSQYILDIDIFGKASHAGMEPENGVSAITIAARAINAMKLGRIDEETTANIGVIEGGMATNIVCDHVKIKAEARSIDKEKLQKQLRHMKECFEKAANELDGDVNIKMSMEYPSYDIENQQEIIDIMKNAADMSNLKLKLKITGGGSDTNIVNSKGISASNISIGMDKMHTVYEKISINDLKKSTEFLINIIKSI